MKDIIKLIALDIDGTLLDDNGNTSANTLLKLKELIDKGIYIIFVTGRTYKSARNIMQKMGLNIPIISYNGAKITLPEQGVIHNSKIPVNAAIKIIEYAEKHDVYVKVYIDDIFYIKEVDEKSINFAKNHGIKYEPIGEISKNITKDVNMVVYIYKSLVDKNVIKNFENMDISITSSTPRVYEFMSKGSTKGNGLKIISDYFGIKKEEVLAVGNALNDLDMLEFAGTGIAMKNSDPNLLRSWDVISEYTNNEEGVYQIIKNL